MSPRARRVTLPQILVPGYRLADVLPGAARAIAATQNRALAVPLRKGSGAWRPDPVARVCVVLVDGLGAANLASRPGHAPTLRNAMVRLEDDGQPWTARTCYPSTTAAALGTLGTGHYPGETRMLGYTVRNPDTGALSNLVSWTNLPAGETWQPIRTVFEAMDDAGLRATTVGPARFERSGMSEANLRGGQYQRAESLDDRVAAAVDSLRTPGLTYLYWGDVDKVGHHEGWQSPQWAREVEKLDQGIASLLAAVPRGTLVVVTADHGMVDVDPLARRDVALDAVLGEGVAQVSGEPRAIHVHVAAGADPQDVAARWRSEIGRDGIVLTRQEAIAAELFGPQVTAAARPVIGDVVVGMLGQATVVDSASQTAASIGLLGVHGGLSEDELNVPLLTWVA